MTTGPEMVCEVVATPDARSPYMILCKNLAGAIVAIEPVDTRQEGEGRARDVMREWRAQDRAKG